MTLVSTTQPYLSTLANSGSHPHPTCHCRLDCIFNRLSYLMMDTECWPQLSSSATCLDLAELEVENDGWRSQESVMTSEMMTSV
jgi:hypothetical protein